MFLKTEIKLIKQFERHHKVELEGVRRLLGKLLDLFVDYAVVCYVLCYILGEAVAEVVRLS